MRLLVAPIALLLAAATASVAEEAPPPTATFTASTAGTPLGLATGGWESTTGSTDRLAVDFVAGPAVAETTFEITWRSALIPRQPSEEPQRLAALVYADHQHNTVTATDTVATVASRWRVVGQPWSAWQDSQPVRTLNSQGERQFAAFALVLRGEIDCTCDVQAEFKIAGQKSGTDASRLTVVTTAG